MKRLLLVSALAAGCAHAPPATPPSTSSPASAPAADVVPAAAAVTTPVAPAGAPAAAVDWLAPLRAAAEEVLRAQGEGAWRAWTAGEPLDPAAAWRGHEPLLAPEALSRLTDARTGASEADRHRLERLRAWLAGEQLARATTSPSQALATARAAATFSWERRPVPLRQLQSLLATEPEAPRRKALADAHAAAAARLAPLVSAREAALAKAAGALGLDAPLALAQVLRGAEPDGLAELARATLARTDATWKALLDGLGRRELKLPAERLRERDLPRLLRTTASAAAFPAGRLLAEVRATLAPLGLELEAGGRITVDATPRPGKIPRPLAVPVEVPAGVRLALTPVAGLDAVRALLHETGAALAWAHADGGAPVEDRRLAPAALAEAWALLVERIAASPAWLAERGLEPAAVAREVRVAAARRLHAAREAALQVLVEVARAREPTTATARWAELAPRAWGHPLDAGEKAPWLLDPDPSLRAAETLRAIVLAAQLEVSLAAQAGDGPWWRSPEAGAWLRRAWAKAGALPPEELLLSLGQAGLGPGALDALTRSAAAAGGMELPPPPPPPPAPVPVPVPTSTPAPAPAPATPTGG